MGRNKNIEPTRITDTNMQPSELHHLEPRRNNGGGKVRILVTTIDHGIFHSVAAEIFGDEQDKKDERACIGRLDLVARKKYKMMVNDMNVREKAKDIILSVRISL